MARQTQSSRTFGTQFEHEGEASVFTCPDCQGTLFLLDENGVIQFRCRIGHLYSPEAMLEAQDDNVERLLWSANRALCEQAEYLAALARQISTIDQKIAHKYSVMSSAAGHRANLLRRLITHGTEEHDSVPRKKRQVDGVTGQ